MFENVRLTAIGLATVLDAVLLIAIVERSNRHRVAAWMWLMIGSTLLFHAGSFVHHLVAEATGTWANDIDWASMVCMSLGLLTLPAAMVHGSVRLCATGLDQSPDRDWRYGLLYLPILMLIPVANGLQTTTSRDYLDLVAWVRKPYTAYFLLASCCSAAGFLMLRNRDEFRHRRDLLLTLAVTFLISAVVVTLGVWIGLEHFPRLAPVTTLVMSMMPAVTVVLVLYYIQRFGLFQLLLERSLVYGAILVMFLLFHAMVFSGLRDDLSDRFRVDFAIVEGVAVIALVLLYAPFRQRVSEALRYLAGARIDQTRVATRELSARMTQLVGQPVEHILARVVADIRRAFDVEHVCIAIHEPEAHAFPELSEKHQQSSQWLTNRIRGLGEPVTFNNLSDGATLKKLDELDASMAILLDHNEIHGVMAVGNKPGNQPLSDEERNALVLLADQLAATLQLDRMQAQRLAAERRAVQQEKLSTLGLLAGSIAHEIRNPLSSMKALTSVMAEDLGPDSEHAEDVGLILSEIDRLTATTTQLLAFARSEPQVDAPVRPAEILQQTLHLMRHVAKRDNIALRSDITAGDKTVTADVNALREIFFNLLKNSLEAAGSDGTVDVSCSTENGHIVTRVSDDGPGIAPEIQDRLFEPFATTKTDGTGLGLYIVGRHVRELGGEIHCRTTAEAGTEFTLKLPMECR